MDILSRQADTVDLRRDSRIQALALMFASCLTACAGLEYRPYGQYEPVALNQNFAQKAELVSEYPNFFVDPRLNLQINSNFMPESFFKHHPFFLAEKDWDFKLKLKALSSD